MAAVEPKASAGMRLQDDADVLIAGAGPAGLTLANDLAARGVSVRVIDPLPEAVRESRAHGMLGRTLKALDKLGLSDPMRAAGKQPPPVLREYFGRKLVAERDFSSTRGEPYPQALPIFQQRTVRVLETALIARGHQVEWSTELVGFTMNEVGVIAEVVRHGTREKIRAKWIVGCEGGHSVVRQTLTALAALERQTALFDSMDSEEIAPSAGLSVRVDILTSSPDGNTIKIRHIRPDNGEILHCVYYIHGGRNGTIRISYRCSCDPLPAIPDGYSQITEHLRQSEVIPCHSENRIHWRLPLLPCWLSAGRRR
ncbi:MAG: FAD-dependent monooxygenase [Steroidobacteraceae bacterium]